MEPTIIETPARTDLARTFRLTLTSDRVHDRVFTPPAAYRNLLQVYLNPNHTFEDLSAALLTYSLAVASDALTTLKHMEHHIGY